MSKLDLHPPLLDYPSDVQSEALAPQLASFRAGPEAVRRLIVLVPTDSDYITATHRIWKLANHLHACVQFLGLCRDAAEEPGLRRQLITMSALVGDARVCTTLKVEIGTNWVQIVKRNYQVGDMIVCFAEQHTGLLHKPLSQILQANINAPVYILSGLPPQNLSHSHGLSQIMAWVGSIGIVVVFFLLQVRLTSLPQDWLQTMLLILSVLGEVCLIAGWNSLFP